MCWRPWNLRSPVLLLTSDCKTPCPKYCVWVRPHRHFPTLSGKSRRFCVHPPQCRRLPSLPTLPFLGYLKHLAALSLTRLRKSALCFLPCTAPTQTERTSQHARASLRSGPLLRGHGLPRGRCFRSSPRRTADGHGFSGPLIYLDRSCQYCSGQSRHTEFLLCVRPPCRMSDQLAALLCPGKQQPERRPQ